MEKFRIKNKSQTVVWAAIDSPIGAITLAASQKGICSLLMGYSIPSLELLQKVMERRFGGGNLQKSEVELLPYIQQLDEYFNGKRKVFNVPIDIDGTSFQMDVWEALQKIPFGETRSYQDVAIAVGSPLAVRAVGGANNRNPLPIFIPCHRVIGKKGSLVGYRGGLSMKQQLLQIEGLNYASYK